VNRLIVKKPLRQESRPLTKNDRGFGWIGNSGNFDGGVIPTPAVSRSAIGEENLGAVPAVNLDQKEGYAPGFGQQTRHVRCDSEGQLSVKVRLVRKKYGRGMTDDS
jgi:hypothetical protein